MMKMLNSKKEIEDLINDNEITIVYFGSNNCNVCNAMKPKIEELLKKYPKIKSAQIDVEISLEAAAAYNVFTIPVILMFIEGKEIIREARFISIQDINTKIERYYNMLIG